MDGGKAEAMTACIEVEGNRSGTGYGQGTVRIGPGRQALYPVLAHRMAYIAAKGSIPDGLVVMHSCDNPPCVNPEHLLLGTPGDNTRDAARKGRMESPKKLLTHCRKGHLLDGRTKAQRYCKTCNNERNRRARALRRTA